MGKGSTRRPAQISRAQYDQQYTTTFSTAMHQNPPHPVSQTGTTGTQAVLLRVLPHRASDGHED